MTVPTSRTILTYGTCLPRPSPEWTLQATPTPAVVERVTRALDKLDALYFGPNHQHWDPTGQSGNGCRTCAYERERNQHLRALLAEARAALAALRESSEA